MCASGKFRGIKESRHFLFGWDIISLESRIVTALCAVSRGQYSQPSSPMSPASMSRHSSLTSSSIGSSSLHSASGSGNGTPVKTSKQKYSYVFYQNIYIIKHRNFAVKHYEDSLKSVKKENFNLKMKIFFLEERLANGNGASTKALINTNTELKVNWIFVVTATFWWLTFNDFLWHLNGAFNVKDWGETEKLYCKYLDSSGKFEARFKWKVKLAPGGQWSHWRSRN